MSAFLRSAVKAFSQEFAKKQANSNLVFLIPLVPFAFVLAVILAVTFLVLIVVSGQNGGGCGTTVPVDVPNQNIQTAAQIVHYFESQGITANGAAGIVGNLQQENGFSPVTNAGGIGIAQWDTTRGLAMQAWDRQNGFDPSTVGGQLAYIVYDLRTHYVSLLAQLNQAPDPGIAATEFQSIYERCGNCVNGHRTQYAIQALQAAGGANVAVPASFTTGRACVALGSSGGDPIPGFTPSRDDMGVDACAKPGMPIYAPASSTLVDVVGNWFSGSSGPQPLLLFQFTPPLTGTYQNDQYWYVAEQILPDSTTKGTQFAAGQPVGTYNQAGTCIEIGWGSPTTNSRTLVPTDANPPAGALTPEAEAFKVFFHIPWVGSSP